MPRGGHREVRLRRSLIAPELKGEKVHEMTKPVGIFGWQCETNIESVFAVKKYNEI